jgi:hypothetical protein
VAKATSLLEQVSAALHGFGIWTGGKSGGGS